MNVIRYCDAAAVLDAARDVFAEDELFTTLPYGVFHRLKVKPDLFGDPAHNYFTCVITQPVHQSCNAEAGAKAASRVVLLAYKTGWFPLAFHLASSSTQEERSEAVALLVRHLDESGQATSVKKLQALTESAESFAYVWNSTAASSGRPPLHPSESLVFLVCDRVEVPSVVVPDNDPVFEILNATEAHVELLADWFLQFQTRLGNDPPSAEENHRMATSWVDGRDGSKAYLLSAEVDGERKMVSMCVTNRQSPNTRTVSMVYTPLELGGRGYATRLVASITHRILSEKRYSCLFADMSNPHSNHVYHKVGYRLHSQWALYKAE